MKCLLPLGTNSLHLEVDPFQKEVCVHERKQCKNVVSLVIKALQALHYTPQPHLNQASAITLSKMKSKGKCISLSLNKVDMNI